MRGEGKAILVCQLVLCAAALCGLACAGILGLIGCILSLPGRVMMACAGWIADGFNEDLDGIYVWLEERR